MLYGAARYVRRLKRGAPAVLRNVIQTATRTVP
jgi:hypothetical protein